MPERRARFEIVRSAAGWHARFRAANGAIVFNTEVYGRRRGAVAAVVGVARAFSPSPNEPWIDTSINTGTECVWTGETTPIEVREVDERPEPVFVVLEAPFWHCRSASGFDFWHDRDTHWRHCFGDECTQTVPPVGSKVQGRLGVVVFTANDHKKASSVA